MKAKNSIVASAGGEEALQTMAPMLRCASGRGVSERAGRSSRRSPPRRLRLRGRPSDST